MSKRWNAGDEITADGLNETGFGLHVVAQETPDLTLLVKKGVAIVNGTVVKYGGGNTPTIAAPAANPRIDIITIDSSGTIALTAGSENASPTVPAYPTDKLVLAEVYCRVGQTQIFNSDQGSGKGYIYRDARALITGTVAIASSTGASDAGKVIKTDAAGKLDLSFSYSDYQAFTGNGTWTKPSWCTGNEVAKVQMWGGGGGGGSNAAAGGGGGGSFVEFNIKVGLLGSTESVVVAAAVAAATAGNNSSFGSWATAYGGGKGFNGQGGGGGGGYQGAGANGVSSSTGGAGGGPLGGSGGTGAVASGSSTFGGGGGGGYGSSPGPNSGGNSIYGGGGGGGGGGNGYGGAGGGSSTYGGGGGGGTSASWGAGGGGTSILGGAGGAGANPTGVAGTAPGGGGGGGNTTGGGGARGEVRVWILK